MFLPWLSVLAGRHDGGVPACRDGSGAGASVIGAICCDQADALAIWDLVKEVGQYGRVADPAADDADGPVLQRVRVDPEVNLAPVTRLRRPVFIGQPPAIAFGIHTHTADQQVQCARRRTIWDLDVQGLLAVAKCAEVRHRPIQPSKIKQTCHHPGRLPRRHREQRLQRQSGLDRGIREDGSRPRFPFGAAIHCVCGSNQTARDPLVASAAL